MLNLGIIKAKINKAYSNDLINNTNNYKKLYESFLNTIKESPALMLTYITFENLKKNNLNYNESIRFIDENIKALSKIDKKILTEELNKLKKFNLDNISISDDELKINKSINTLIEESVIKDITNVNYLHESVNILIESLTKEVKNINDNIDETNVYNIDDIFNVAKIKLQEKFSKFGETELKILNSFIENNKENQKKLFENYKIETKKYLLQEKDNITSEVLSQTFEFIDKLNFNEKTIIDDFSKLFEIKNLKNE
jgi:hypothetical protein